ncbi:STAS domain-containing protein [Modestobacter sp. I12A-02628]|uniref:STAS domain-containing protein n=1 Tax=Goekera deserti TaxID=2497753 RepID=A0A7K3WKJ6_9ACTN|nr:STAS domain-containing protein [Goekera deserti]MPQ97806.1 STAS domain-containing protein [Goekera deserti]NDI48451.1 STAS domain-containing protein [Goekera deserti]NEL56053.1 STAS domain-containing protein [Goekera deserti]
MSGSNNVPDGVSQGRVCLVDDAGQPVLHFSGEIDRQVVREFRVTVPPARWPARADVRDVTYMSSAGLELLVHLGRKQKRAGCELELVEPSRALRELLAQTGLYRVFRSVSAARADARS